MSQMSLKRVVDNMRAKNIPEDVIKLYLDGSYEWNRLERLKSNVSAGRQMQYNDWTRENRLREKVRWEKITLEKFIELRRTRRR